MTVLLADHRKPVTAEQVRRQAQRIVADSYLAGTVSEAGTVVLVDRADPTAEDGLGRTFLIEVTVTEVPR